MTLQNGNAKAAKDLHFVIEDLGRNSDSKLMCSFKKYLLALYAEGAYELLSVELKLISDVNGHIYSSNYFLDEMKKKHL